MFLMRPRPAGWLWIQGRERKWCTCSRAWQHWLCSCLVVCVTSFLPPDTQAKATCLPPYRVSSILLKTAALMRLWCAAASRLSFAEPGMPWGNDCFCRLSSQGRISRHVLKNPVQKGRCLNSLGKQHVSAVPVGCPALARWLCWKKRLSSSSPSFLCFVQDPNQGPRADLLCAGPGILAFSAKGP